MSATAWVRRHRTTTVLVLAILVTAAALSVVTARSSVQGTPLDPDNPAPAGAQAVARVLSRQGVRLTVVRRAAELARAEVDADTTVLVTSPDNLGRATARQLRRRTVGAGALVLAGPGPTLIRALRLPVSVAGVDGRGAAGSKCDDPLLGDLSLDVGPSAGYRTTGGPSTTSCFPGPGPRPAALVVRVDRGTPTYAVGGTDLFTNDRVDRADNAAAALRMLGQRDRLLWYVPDSRDIAVGDAGSLTAQLPRGLFPALWLLAVAVLATMLWRGRRLGPLVVEPLPVVVKAIESTQGRGRLYRRVRDRSHAATTLREASARRLTADLRLPPGTDPRRLVEAVARTTGADPGAVHDVLVARPVGDDDSLVRLAADLTALEREVHQA
jgi:Domain of unknown function (DUF4350)